MDSEVPWENGGRGKPGLVHQGPEEKSQECPAGGQVGERMASPGSDGGSATGHGSSSGRAWVATNNADRALAHCGGIGLNVPGLGRNYGVLREKIYADVPGKIDR